MITTDNQISDVQYVKAQLSCVFTKAAEAEANGTLDEATAAAGDKAFEGLFAMATRKLVDADGNPTGELHRWRRTSRSLAGQMGISNGEVRRRAQQLSAIELTEAEADALAQEELEVPEDVVRVLRDSAAERRQAIAARRRQGRPSKKRSNQRSSAPKAKARPKTLVTA